MTLRFAQAGLSVVAIVLLGFWAAALFEESIYQRRYAERFEGGGGAGGSRTAGLIGGPGAPSRAGSTSDTSEDSHHFGPGDPIGMIEVPRLGLSAVIAEGTDRRTLRHAVGHVEHTALPGESGNVALAAHRDSFFRRLKDLRQNDTVRILTEGRSITYLVDSMMVVGPTRLDLLRPGRDSTLTLITCYPFYFVGPAPERFVVSARMAPDTLRASAAGP